MWIFLWRELRGMSRHPGSYSLRWMAAGLLMTGFAWAWWTLRIVPAQAGPGLFGLLGRATLLLIWLGAPLVTADCIAREKREGTLGLLWLTSLTPGQVIAAKTVAEALRAVVMLLATFPVMLVPVLLGGVGWPEVIRLGLLQASALSLALASGVAASAIWRGWLAVRLGAVGLNLLALLVFVGIHQLTWVLPQWRQAVAAGVAVDPGELMGRRLTMAWWQFQAFWRGLERGRLPVHPPVSWVAVTRAGWMALGCLAMALFTARLAAMGLVRSMKHDAIGQPLRQRSRRRRGWVRWAVGMVGGLWLAGAWVDWPTVDFVRDLGGIGTWILVSISVATGVHWIQRDRQAGVWELLAVIPGGITDVLRGNERRMWTTFLPGWFLFGLAHGVAVMAVLQAGERYPWWLPAWLMGRALETVLLGWVGCWWGGWLVLHLRRGGSAVVIGVAALWAVGSLTEAAVAWGLNRAGVGWSGLLAEPWPAGMRRGLRGIDVLSAWLVTLGVWTLLGGWTRARLLAVARDPGRL
jgi:hypothetical protein